MGVVDRYAYVGILEKTLLPFIKDIYLDSHHFMADNDPKYTLCHAKKFLVDNYMNWWRTPAESTDLNPIENLWHGLQEYIRREVKPTIKEELVNGILKFWETVDVNKCSKYIRHLFKVIPKIIELNGGLIGY